MQKLKEHINDVITVTFLQDNSLFVLTLFD